jgi:hypothetical protein
MKCALIMYSSVLIEVLFIRAVSCAYFLVLTTLLNSSPAKCTYLATYV